MRDAAVLPTKQSTFPGTITPENRYDFLQETKSQPRNPHPGIVSKAMMECTLSRDAVRELDRVAIEDYGIPGIVLMENAGRNAAELLCSKHLSGPIVICCGKGNNGGDGFVIARHLENQGATVHILSFADPDSLRGDARTNFRIIKAAGIPLTVVSQEFDQSVFDSEFIAAEWIVDALLGTGMTGEVRKPYSSVISRINESSAKVFAVDLPSGLDCDTGQPMGECVRADVTATFVAKKSGFLQPTAREWVGEVHVIDIGIPRALRERALGENKQNRGL